MKNILFILVILMASGCSSLTKSKMYGALGGALVCGVLGASLGKELSPDKSSIKLNRMMGASIGASTCALGGYYIGKTLYESDSRNMEYEPIKFENKKQEATEQEVLNSGLENLDLSDLAMTQDGLVNIPLIKSLPKELRSKVNKQKLIKYKIKPQVIKTKDGRFLYFSGGEAIEHKYQTAQ